MPFILNCGERHPVTFRTQTDRHGYHWMAETARMFPDSESLRIVERKRIEERSYVVVDRTINGFGHNFEPKGDNVSCPACGSEAKLRVLSATL